MTATEEMEHCISNKYINSDGKLRLAVAIIKKLEAELDFRRNELKLRCAERDCYKSLVERNDNIASNL